MARQKPRTSSNREDLPQLIGLYLLGLEGVLGREDFEVLLSDDVRWSRDGKTWIDGKAAVLQQIEDWQGSVESVRIEMREMQDYEDGCVKVNFVVHCEVRKEDTVYEVLQGVMAMYMTANQKLEEILEYWQAVPPAAREYQ